MFNILKIILFILSVQYNNSNYFFIFGYGFCFVDLEKVEKSIKPKNMSTKEEPKPIKI